MLSSRGVTRGRGPPRVTSSRGGGGGGGGGDTRMKVIFVAEFTENTVQTTLEGGEGGSDDETTGKNRSPLSHNDDQKSRQVFKRKKIW